MLSLSHRVAIAALVVSLSVPLAACAEPTRIPDAEPSSGVTPLFASDEEALAAATAAYEEFLAVSGEILRDGGADPERLKPLVSDEVYEREAEGFSTLSSNGWRATGQTIQDAVTLQQHTPGPVDSLEIVTYHCVSIIGTDVLDSEGISQIDPDRPTRLGFEVVFSASESGELVVVRKTLWDTDSACLT